MGIAGPKPCFLNGLAEMDLLDGELVTARNGFEIAGRIMGNWATSSSEVYGAIIGQEGSKTWKGDPHEKAMNAFYTGVLYWMTGQPDNARAAFKKGLLADGESDEGDAQRDFALLSWLAGRASLAMGLPQDAEAFFREAREARVFATKHGARGEPTNRLLERPVAGNVILLFGLGLGPSKVRGGDYGQLARVQPNAGGPVAVDVSIDGQSVGRSQLMADLDYQASTRGGRVMAGILQGKAVFKEVTELTGAALIGSGLTEKDRRVGVAKVATGAGLLLFSALTQAKADVRHWATLPKSVHALVADVSPGVHDLQLEYVGLGGHPMPNLRRTLQIEVPEPRAGRQAIVWSRSLPAPRNPLP